MSYKKWAVVAGIILVAGIFTGALDTGGSGIFTTYIEGLKKLAGTLEPRTFSTFLVILTQNVTALVISFVLSPLLLIIPLISLLANGWLLGYISSSVMEQHSASVLLAGILPHGIFEIPALVIAQAAALNWGANAILRMFTRKRGQPVFPIFRRNSKYLLMALVLLVPAALMETYVTPLLLKLFSN